MQTVCQSNEINYKMNKTEKLSSLLNPDVRNFMLTDFLAPESVRKELMSYLKISTEDELLNFLGVDFYYLSFRDISQNESCLPYYRGTLDEFTGGTRICPFGILWHRKVFNDKFGVDEAITGPFAGGDYSEKDVLDHSWPNPLDFDFSGLNAEAERNRDKLIVGGLWSAIQGDCARMMGFENYLLSTALNRPFVKTLINRLTDFYLETNERYFNCLKGNLDIFFMGNDFGTQSGLLIAEEDWYELFYENYKKLINLAHSYNLKVMVHSCGSIEPLLPHFIELGVDIIDPVQITAKDMDPAGLSLKYGKDLAFHGGIDTQEVMPFGTPKQVVSHLVELVAQLNQYGNLIVAPSNNFMPGTPVENILKLYEVAAAIKDPIGTKHSE